MDFVERSVVRRAPVDFVERSVVRRAPVDFVERFVMRKAPVDFVDSVDNCWLSSSHQDASSHMSQQLSTLSTRVHRTITNFLILIRSQALRALKKQEEK